MMDPNIKSQSQYRDIDIQNEFDNKTLELILFSPFCPRFFAIYLLFLVSERV